MAEGQPGRIIISAEEQAAVTNNEIVKFTPVATMVDEQNLCFFLVYRNMAPGKFTPIYKSEVKSPNNGTFTWNEV